MFQRELLDLGITFRGELIVPEQRWVFWTSFAAEAARETAWAPLSALLDEASLQVGALRRRSAAASTRAAALAAELDELFQAP